MAKSTLVLVGSIFGSVLAASLALSACQPGAVEEGETSTSAAVGGTCGDPKGCVAVNAVSGSYYTGAGCTGTEYGPSSSRYKNSWDGYGLMGKTLVNVTTISYRDPAGVCHVETDSGSMGRIYRDAPTCSPACASTCQTCVNGTCVAVGNNYNCAASVCSSSTQETDYICQSGACTTSTFTCTTTCDPATGLCSGTGS